MIPIGRDNLVGGHHPSPEALGRSKGLASGVVAVLALVLVTGTAMGAQETMPGGGAATGQRAEGDPEASPVDSSTVIYDKQFFERYNVTTVLDMLRRVPGIDSILNPIINPPQNQQAVRGFGSGGDQILINGKRIAGKANEISAALERIQATLVERIELIRGTTADIDVRSEGLIINIVVAGDTGEKGVGSWRASVLLNDTGKALPGGFISYSNNLGRLQYLISLETSPTLETRIRDEEFFSPDGALIQLRDETEPTSQRPHRLTGNLVYAFANGDEVRLNGLLSKTDKLVEEDSDQFAVDDMGVASFLQTELRRDATELLNWEVGVDYEKKIGDTGRLKALLIYSYEQRDAEEDERRIDAGGTTVLNLELSDILDTEAIIRASFAWDVAPKHKLEIGAEGASNRLDTDLQIFEDQNGILTELDFFNPDSAVKERRFEGFATDKWKVSSSMSAEIGLNGEFSRLSQQGSEIDNSRIFFFLKPRFDFRYDVTPASQLRFKIERTVKQLNFEDFVAEFDFQDDEVDFGNPDLKPENAWQYEVRYENRLPNDNGVIEARAFLEDIADHIDKGPIDIDNDGVFDTDVNGLLREAQANIGDALLFGAEIKASLRMTWIKLPEAVLNLRFKAQKSETTDPFTGKKRRMFRKTNFEWEAGFRHEIIKWGLSYGTNLVKRIGARRTDEVRSTWLFTDGVRMNAFIEAKLFWSMTLRVDADRLLRNKAVRNRPIFLTSVADGTLRRFEHFDRISDRIVTVTIRGTF